jgi:hypothetical protein
MTKSKIKKAPRKTAAAKPKAAGKRAPNELSDEELERASGGALSPWALNLSSTDNLTTTNLDTQWTSQWAITWALKK